MSRIEGYRADAAAGMTRAQSAKNRGVTRAAVRSAGIRHGIEFPGKPPIRVIDQAIPEPNSGCWLWEKGLSKSGYGSLRANGKSALAHRASWEETYGKIPKGMVVCHRCDVPACVNPEHLFIGSQRANMADMAAKGRGCRLALIHRKGAAHQVKLSDSAVVSILLAHAQGLSIPAVAAAHEISKTSVWNIIHNKTWRHVPRPAA